MPKEYEHCKESYIKKGVAEKKAKEICAGMYYNRHKMTVNEAHKRGIKSMKENYIYVARTKEALKGYLEVYNLNPNDYVIIPIQETVRNNPKVKSLVPKIENEDYKYMMVNKCILEVTTDAKLVLKMDKLKENSANKQNTNNEPEVEKVQGVVKEGKVKSLRSTKTEAVTKNQPLNEKQKELMLDALNYLVEAIQKDELTDSDKELVLTMASVLSGEAELDALERAVSDVKLSVENFSDEDTSELPDSEDVLKMSGVDVETVAPAKEETSEEESDDESSQEVLVSPEVEKTKLENKTMTAAGNSAQSMEKEDMETPDMDEPDEEDDDNEEVVLKKMLKSHNSLDDTVPVFMEKHQAIKFLREYQNKTKSRAMLVPAGNKYQKIFGTKAKYVVEIER